MEEWKEIADFPGYQVSNAGHIRNVHRPGKILRTYNSHKNGTVTIFLTRDKHTYCRTVAALTATAFLPKPDGGNYYVKHLNGDRHDNRVCNLQWSDKRENKKSKPVYCYNEDWELIKKYRNAGEAAQIIDGSAGSIRNVCNGIGYTYRTYHWSYSSPDQLEDDEAERDFRDGDRAIFQYAGKPGREMIVRVWDNYLEASHNLDIDPDAILRCCRGGQKKAGGYAWDFADRYLPCEKE